VVNVYSAEILDADILIFGDRIGLVDDASDFECAQAIKEQRHSEHGCVDSEGGNSQA
jgi:adenine deaminase